MPPRQVRHAHHCTRKHTLFVTRVNLRLIPVRLERPAEAEHALLEGLALARAIPYPYAEARLLHVQGRLSAELGEAAAGRERLEAALDIFQRLGARKDVERVEQALAALQRQPPA